MKTIVSIATLVWLSCAVVLAQSTDQPAAKPETGSKQGLPCFKGFPAAGYTNAKLAKSKREIKIYNVDFADEDNHNPKHDPICLSQGNRDTILWISGEGKKFTIKIRAAENQDPHCGQHPFTKEPPPPKDTQDDYFSGSLRPGVPFYCLYEVELHEEGGPVTDPHIQTTPP